MNGKKIVYNKEIVMMVIHVFKKNSEIYLAMMNGEIISEKIKQSIKTKGDNYRIKDKKTLFKLCKEAEEKFLESEEVVGV